MQTVNTRLARNIDLINEFVLNFPKYYPDAQLPLTTSFDILREKNDFFKMTLEEFRAASFIMEDQGYILIEEISLKEVVEFGISGKAEYFKATPKGILLYLNGGITQQVKNEKNKNRLYIIGQISLVIAGLYYLLEILKNFSCH